MELANKNDRTTKGIILLLGVLIFSYTAFRAYVLSITWDEAYSYLQFVRNGILFPDKYEMMDANNHLLNTWLNIHLVKYFGVNEFVLRLPSLCSHLLFLFFSYKLIKEFQNKWLVIISFLIINLNPYLLDFFSLSRGYGLSIGLMMTSIYYLYAFHTKEEKVKYAFLTVFFGSLASLANFVALNYFLVSFGLLMFLIILDHFQSNANLKEKSRLFFKTAVFPAIIFFITLLFIVPITLKLKDAGALFYGGKKGFWTDTFCTITDRCFYEQGYNYWFQRIAKGFVILIVISASCYVALKKIKKRINNTTMFIGTLVLLIGFCALSSIVQHQLLGTLYLIDRTALFFVVLFNLLFVFFINELAKQNERISILIYLTGAIAVFHFALSFNTSYVLEWKSNADVKQMVSDLEKVKEIPAEKMNVSIGIPLSFDQSINFYRAVEKKTWINTVERSNKIDYRDDYVYLEPSEYVSMKMDSIEVIKTYPVTNNILARPKYKPNITKVCYEKELSFEKYPGYVIDSKIEYAEGFTYMIGDSSTQGKVETFMFSAQIMATDIRTCNLGVILSIENDKGTYLWKRAFIKDYIFSANVWAEVCFSSNIPSETKKGDIIKAYIWNPYKQKLFVKKMTFKCIGKQ